MEVEEVEAIKHRLEPSLLPASCKHAFAEYVCQRDSMGRFHALLLYCLSIVAIEVLWNMAQSAASIQTDTQTDRHGHRKIAECTPCKNMAAQMKPTSKGCFTEARSSLIHARINRMSAGQIGKIVHFSPYPYKVTGSIGIWDSIDNDEASMGRAQQNPCSVYKY